MNLYFAYIAGNINKGWIRFYPWGHGFTWKNLKRYDLGFSQRYGYVKFVKIGNYIFEKI